MEVQILNNMVTFGVIEIGKTFMHDGVLYIKNTNGGAITIGDGFTDAFSDNDECIPVSIESVKVRNVYEQ